MSVSREWALRWIGRSTNVSYNSGSAKESKHNGSRQCPLLGKPEANVCCVLRKGRCKLVLGFHD